MLSTIWALGSLIAVGGLGYLVQDDVGRVADARSVATTPDVPPPVS
ncbi:hypothetical protein [Streptomyces cavernicola]|uniref:Uncharacterized protein n=1 Tax=Streptomyces cavernicola TaxID=3043613 RepID=A0ABT6S433_9ACTN|nr:hypothetical protein [Streptomyces sp. B-S-A6]MDI3402860.1 hypothetical protein [Streptomyces sp. B-S-A6]